MARERIWQASEARAHFAEVVEDALTGAPQVIRKRNGEEVVLLSRASFELMKPNLKDYLLRSAGAAGEDDDSSLEAALGQVRRSGGPGLLPRTSSDAE
ncbi:type II toxin-antitoxin system Phd/YefM family antitoxin [Dongia sp.]|uniref:type II toxin-antitoxin system Phd/YefM family antitoxin n=1 Tax=Dongia sp. TaxID=1977262 RepID=UPI0035ADA807